MGLELGNIGRRRVQIVERLFSRGYTVVIVPSNFFIIRAFGKDDNGVSISFFGARITIGPYNRITKQMGDCGDDKYSVGDAVNEITKMCPL